MPVLSSNNALTSIMLLLITEPLDDGFSNRDVPSFLPPSCFSKFDRPNNYVYVCLKSKITLFLVKICHCFIRYRPHFKSCKPVSIEDGSAIPLSKSIKSKKFNLAYAISFNSTSKLFAFYLM